MSRRDQRDSRVSVLVKNLPLNARAEDLRAKFERFGDIRDVYLPRDYYSGRARGFGFVEFVDPRDADDAVHEMDGRVVGGREIQADVDVQVCLSQEKRKTPREMAVRDDQYRKPSRGGGRDRSRSRDRDRRRSRSRDRRRSYSPKRRSRSRSASPRRRRSESRSRSPRRRSPSPRRRSPSPRGRSRSPRRDASRSRSRSVKSEEGARRDSGSPPRDEYDNGEAEVKREVKEEEEDDRD